ncbi:MAG: PQQ-dependent sugar dehydrogenase [Saprospiraceae bacterium]
MSCLTLIILIAFSCKEVVPAVNNANKEVFDQYDDLPLEKISLPDGFKIELYATDVLNARSMALSPSGVLFVGTRSAGNVYALVDSDGDNKVDKKYTLLEKGNMPNGVAFKDGDLYIAEVNRILKISAVESKLDNPGTPEVIYDKYPEEKHHGWKYIDFGPDGKLYVPVGAPCNICNSEKDIYNSITRINSDGTDMEIIQRGVRNTVGFTWHPESNDLWFTDNGRDMMGDDVPACELNRANKDNMHFGFPFCHQGDLPDPEYGKLGDCKDYIVPAQNLGAHTAPLGIEFYTGNSFPEEYKNVAMIAEHGSWNRTKKQGYRISMVKLDNNFNSQGYEFFATGWLDEENDEAWGRPVDIELMPDGSMLISDDFADVIYRITYKG